MLHEYQEQLWNALQEGVCITDDKGIILYLNTHYSEITGVPKEKILGQPAGSLVELGVFDVVLNPEVIASRRPTTRVQTISNGRKVILQGNPVFDALGCPVLCITFVRDVTKLMELREQLLQQKELLETFQQFHNATKPYELSRTLPNTAYNSQMRNIFAVINTLSETDATVLLLGETGVGKDVFAQRIHHLSGRKGKPFIKVDCGSIPENLIETELFGYMPGTFSGSSRNGKIGLVEAANGGTLFLDEIGELPMPMQCRLLRFLQDREIMRVGATAPKVVDVRVLAATNKDLKQAVNQGKFRSDLYYRLKVVELEIPPLRERQQEIIPLARIFLQYYANKYHKNFSFAEDAEQLLRKHTWPGNIRELENLVQGLVITCSHSQIRAADLPFRRSRSTVNAAGEGYAGTEELLSNGESFKNLMKRFEARVLIDAMRHYKQNLTAVAEHLQLDRSTVFRKVKELERQGVRF